MSRWEEKSRKQTFIFRVVFHCDPRADFKFANAAMEQSKDQGPLQGEKTMATMTAPRTGRTSESRSQSFEHSDESGHAIRDAATALGEGAENVASALVNKVDEAAAATGRGIETVAEQIRSHTPTKGIVGTASSKLADSLEYGGRYLEKQGVTGMTDDVTMLIRNNPITALLTAVGVGFLIARATTCRNS